MQKRMKGKGVISLMTIVVTVALVAISMPLYANHNDRKAIITQISQLSDIKTTVTNEILESIQAEDVNKGLKSNVKAPSELPKDVNVSGGGVITMSTDKIVKNSKVNLIPVVRDGFVVWYCTYEGLKAGQAPMGCERAEEYND